MSIINDALKKTQASLQKNMAETVPPPQPPPAKATPKEPMKPVKVKAVAPQQPPPPPPEKPVVIESKGISKPPSHPPKKSLATIEQKEKEKKFERIPTKSSAASSKQAVNPGDFSPVTRIIFLLIVFLAIAALFVYKNPLKLNFSKSSIPFSRPVAPIAEKKKIMALFGKTEQAANASKKKNGLILEGVITQNGKQFALINNEVYQEGGMVQGKKILSISLDKVVLLDAFGNTVTLINKANR